MYKSHELDYVLKQSDMKALCVIDAYRDVDYLKIIRDLVPESLEAERGHLKSGSYPFLEHLIYMGPEKHRGFYSVPELVLLGSHMPEDSIAQVSVNNGIFELLEQQCGLEGEEKGSRI